MKKMEQLSQQIQVKLRKKINMIILLKKKHQSFLVIFTIVFTFLIHKPSFAQCVCKCISGRVQPVCSQTPAVMPICPPRICPARGPAVTIPKRLVDPPPKIKPSNCQQRRVKNPNTNQYIWRTICRPENSFQ